MKNLKLNVTKKYDFKIVQSGYGKTLEEAWTDALSTLASQDMPLDEADIISEEDAPYMDNLTIDQYNNPDFDRAASLLDE